jgi:hypothetical protein
MARRRRHNPDRFLGLDLDRPESFLNIAAIIAGAFLLYNLIKGFKFIGQAASSGYQAGVTAATPISAPIAAVAVGLQNLAWKVLGQNISLTGNVLLPDGTYIAMNSGKVAIALNSDGNTYATVGDGHIYQMQPSDINGDWPLTLVQ